MFTMCLTIKLSISTVVNISFRYFNKYTCLSVNTEGKQDTMPFNGVYWCKAGGNVNQISLA